MKMNYLRKSNQRQILKRLVPVVIVVLFAGITFSIHIIAPDFFPRILNAVALPIWQARNGIADRINHTVDLIRSKQDLITQNETLTQKLAILKAALISKDMIERENTALRQMLGRNDLSKTLLAEVLVRPPQSAYDTLILDVGSANGVRIRDKIVFPPDIVLGEIIEISEQTSKVKLFSTAGNKINIIIERNNISTIASGLGGGNLTIQLPREVNIEKGDLAILPGSSHLIVGFVEDIELDVTDSLARVLLKSPINIAETRFVLVRDYPL